MTGKPNKFIDYLLRFDPNGQPDEEVASLLERIRQLEEENKQLREVSLALKANGTFHEEEIVSVVGEIVRYFREKSELSLGAILNSESNCRRDELVVKLTAKSQELLDKILWANIRLGILKNANIKDWVASQVAKDLIRESFRKKRGDIPRNEVRELVNSLLEGIDKIGKDLMAGIDLSK